VPRAGWGPRPGEPPGQAGQIWRLAARFRVTIIAFQALLPAAAVSLFWLPVTANELTPAPVTSLDSGGLIAVAGHWLSGGLTAAAAMLLFPAVMVTLDRLTDPLPRRRNPPANETQPRQWSRYAALGDSLTAGRGATGPGGWPIGWARRLAGLLAARTGVRCELTNLAADDARLTQPPPPTHNQQWFA
jgi:hypothetical protein